MSCPNWQELAAHRAARSKEEPEGWREALLHFDACKECREEALAAEPTLIFRRLPEPVAEESWEAEIASVQQAVAAMRTASRLERLQTSPRRRVLGRSWKEWAAAAALVATVGGAGSWYGLASRQVDSVQQPLPPLTRPAAPAFVPAASKIEVLEGSYSKVLELGGETRDDIAVTWILGENLEV